MKDFTIRISLVIVLALCYSWFIADTHKTETEKREKQQKLDQLWDEYLVENKDLIAYPNDRTAK